MVLSATALPSRLATRQCFRMPAVEAFPTSLSVIRLAGLEDHLDAQTIARLQHIENRLQEEVPVALILTARSERGLERAFLRAYEVAADYYIESGILIWRSLNHDYAKLLRLSQASGKVVEKLFFEHAYRLERATFIKAVAGLRVLARIGDLAILADEKTAPESRNAPLEYLAQVTLATFVTWCLLKYIQGETRTARRLNLRALADFLLSVGSKAYQDALGANLYPSETERTYWSPAWQEGEVEADLDKHLGAVKSFDSVDDLIRDLRRP